MNRLAAAYPPDRVVLREVGLRDGLQMVSRYPSTAAQVKWLRAEHDAGVRHFEIGSFLPAKPSRTHQINLSLTEHSKHVFVRRFAQQYVVADRR